MNDQIQSILNKAQESLQVAYLLAEQGFLDFAVSRAYYAMFYPSEALLLSRGLSFSSHSAVLATNGKEYLKTKDPDPKYHKYLITTQDYRNQGDYGFGPSVPVDQVQDALSQASEFLEVERAYLGE